MEHALRIAIIENEVLVEERLLQKRGRVSFGPSPRDSFIVAWPRSRTLFEPAPAGWALRTPEGGRTPLRPGARGKLVVGELTILYQVVAAEASPAPRLPPSLRTPLSQRFDWIMIAIVGATLGWHAGFVAYLHQLDWPRTPDIVEIPKRPVTYRRNQSPRIVVAPVAKSPAPIAAPGPTGGPRRTGPRRSGPRPGDAAKLARMVLFGAPGEGRTIEDVVKRGPDAEEAFRDVGGVGVATGESGLRTNRGAGGTTTTKGIGGLRAEGPGEVATGERGLEEVAVLRAKVRVTEPPTVTGGGNPEVIAAAIRRRKTALQACYERALRDAPHLAGKIDVQFWLAPDGRVARIDIEEDTLGDDRVATCIRAIMATWRFPPTGARGVVRVSYPFLFVTASGPGN